MRVESFAIHVEELRDRPETALVRLEGVLDLDGVALANRKILPLIDRGCVNLAFDCTLLRYLNSPALGSLIAYTKKAREQGGECNLFGVSPDVLDVLEVVGVTRILRVHPTRQAALAELVPEVPGEEG
jgi:anti-anti-sigma factor